MPIAAVGLNHNTAPVEMREKLAIPSQRLPDVFARLIARGAAECAVLSTCNRTEAYLLTDDDDGASFVAEEFAAIAGINASELAGHLYTHVGADAAAHLFRVASGVDSMVLGESQILGQVRQAYEHSLASGAAGFILRRLFETALAAGKRVQTETGINKGAVSVGSIAVDLAESIFGDLAGRRVMLLGAGEMGELVADRLVKCGATGVVVANRTFERAKALAERFGGRAVRFEGFEEEMVRADIVIASTGSPHFVVRREPLERIMRARQMRPVFLIDIAVPRDVEPSVADIECAFLYDIDDLNSIVARSARERRSEVARAEEIIQREVLQFLRWHNSQVAVPVIRGLRGRLERLADEEIARYAGRLSHLEDKDQALVREMLFALVNKISHHPITHIKDYANGDGADRLQTVVEVFGIDHETDERATKEGP